MENKKTFEQVLDEQGYLLYSNVGCSMWPLIREGRDLMIIESVKTRLPQLYDAVLFRRPGVSGRGEYVLHRILKVNPDGTYWIAGDNTVSGETVSPDNVLGVLIEVKRNFHRRGRNNACNTAKKKRNLAHLGEKSRINRLVSQDLKFDDPRYRLYVRIWCKPYRARFALKQTLTLTRRLLLKKHRDVV